jgi:hypothetical protein
MNKFKNVSRFIKFVFVFLVIAVSISCSKKGVFLPVESAYSEKVRAILDSAHYFVDTNYPIKLTDKLPFQEAYYRDSKEFINVLGIMDSEFLVRYVKLKKLHENIEKKYFIVSCDNEYIYFGILNENNTELYTKYNPITKDNKENSVIKTRNYRKYYYWIIQEMNKGHIISIDGSKRIRIAKSFNPSVKE